MKVFLFKLETIYSKKPPFDIPNNYLQYAAPPLACVQLLINTLSVVWKRPLFWHKKYESCINIYGKAGFINSDSHVFSLPSFGQALCVNGVN